MPLVFAAGLAAGCNGSATSPASPSPAAGRSETMLFTQIDHPAISCRDPQAQVDWYCRNLGMRVIATNGQQPPSAILGFGEDGVPGGSILEIMPVKDAGPSPAEMPRFAPGLRHLAFRVSDFEKAYAKLKSAGVTFLFEPTTAVGGGKIVSFRDPEGNELQIVQR
jgi:glyoxylase I family protein